MALTKISNNSLSSISTLPASIPTGSLTLISTQTASASASIEFTSGIDSTYDSYVFKFINIHPSVDGVFFQFNGSTDSGSTYAVTKTSTVFRAHHDEADSTAVLGYRTAEDLAQSTNFQTLALDVGNDNDQNVSGYVQIFNPSSSVFVKHFIARSQTVFPSDLTLDVYVAGYLNTSSPIDAIKFQMSSGSIDDGIIKLYGVS